MTSSGLTLQDFYGAWELYSMPALTGAVVGLVLGVLGVYIVLRRMVFLAASLAQAASLGVALTFFLGTVLTVAVTAPDGLGGVTTELHPAGWLPSPTVGAMLLTFLATVLVAGRRVGASTWRDAALGAVFLVGAAGTLALGTRIVEELHDIDTLLFGSAVAVVPEDFTLVLELFLTVLAVHVLAWRGFTAASFDYAGARVRGIPVRALELALFATLAVTISVGTRIIGALPVFALSVLPAVAAARLARNLPVALAGAGLLGVVAGFYGYVLAFLLDLPVGASQALVAAAIAGLAELARAVPTLFVVVVRTQAFDAREEAAFARLSPALLVAQGAALVAALYLLLLPALAGVAPGLASPDLALAAGVVALAVALGGILATARLRRLAIALGLVVAAAWVALAMALDGDVALVRPLLLAGGAFAVATSLREARLPPVSRRS
ncbi:MAG: metal ABC transporter permease [Deltaproteobacteria bacterium]|nr:metal ABC transporter permease [Deltaproteobacteria bacterium]